MLPPAVQKFSGNPEGYRVVITFFLCKGASPETEKWKDLSGKLIYDIVLSSAKKCQLIASVQLGDPSAYF